MIHIKIYDDGTFYLDKCKVGNVLVENYSYRIEQIEVGKLNSVCTPNKEQLYTQNPLENGYKYDCKVDPNKDPYSFYVIGNSYDGKIDLIMDQNINSDGSPAGTTVISKETNSQKYNLVEWYAPSNSNLYGPVTAIEFLYNATKTWTNVNPLNYTYNDNGYDCGYKMLTSTNGIANIISNTDPEQVVTIGNALKPLRAKIEMWISGDFKYDNLVYVTNEGISSGPQGYWGMSASNTGTSDSAGFVDGYNRYENFTSVQSQLGIRPVITLDI